MWNPKSRWAKRNAKSFTRVPVLIMSRSFAFFCICTITKKGREWEEKMEEKPWEAAAAAVARPCWVLSLGVAAGRHSNLLTSSALYYSKTLCWIKDNHHLDEWMKISISSVRKWDKHTKQMAGGLFFPVLGAVYILKWLILTCSTTNEVFLVWPNKQQAMHAGIIVIWLWRPIAISALQVVN